MTAFPWFRVYNEILNERKIERIRRMTGLPRVVVRGAWVTLLAMANDSPQRGCLMWTDDLWITEQELCDDLEMDPANFAKLLAAFKTMNMISEHSNGLSCTNFGKRQFKSDNSTARVQAHRARQKAPKAQAETVSSNVSETLLCNAPEAEAELESETEAEREPAPPAIAAPAVPVSTTFPEWQDEIRTSTNRTAVLRRMCIALYPGLDPPTFGRIGTVAGKVGGAGRLAELLWQHCTRPPTGNLMSYIQGAAKNGNRNNGRRESEPVEQAIGWVDE